MQKHFDILMKGIMKGQGYALLAMKEADKLNIKGTVGYTNDNYLFMEVEGEENNLHDFIRWCKTCTHQSNIEEVIIKQDKYKNYNEFEIRNL